MFRLISTHASLDFSYRCFFKIMNFSDFRCFKLFYRFEKQLLIDFLEFPKKIFKKSSVIKSRFINVAKRLIQNSVKYLRWSFLLKQLTGKSHLLFDVRLSSKYASVLGLNSFKDIFQPCFDANSYYQGLAHLFAIFLKLLQGRGYFIADFSTSFNLRDHWRCSMKKILLKNQETSH